MRASLKSFRGQAFAAFFGLAVLALSANSLGAQSSYRRIDLEHGVSLEVPEHWTVKGLDERKNNSAAVDSMVEGTIGERAPSYITSLSVVSVPSPVRAIVRISFHSIPGLTQAEFLSYVKADRAGTLRELRNSLSAEIIEMPGILSKAGLKMIGEVEVDIGKVGQLHGYVLRYRRTSREVEGIFLVEQYHLPIGQKEVLATFSYLEKEVMYKVIVEKIIRSVQKVG